MGPKDNRTTQFSIGSGSSPKLALHSKGKANKYGVRAKPLAFHDDDDQDDDDNEEVELLAGFENNKSKELKPKEERKPLTIAPLANVDWKARKKVYIPARAELSRENIERKEVSREETSFGLQIVSKKEPGAIAQLPEQKEGQPTTQEVEKEPLSLEEQAMAAIIKEASTNGEPEEERSTLVIPANEVEALREDVRHRPDEPTIDAYEKIPVHEFGAALLRGLGWKEGEGIGRNRKNSPAPVVAPAKQREELLGLGAQAEGERNKRNRRSLYEYKETSLFKKISKRKYDERDKRESSSSSSSSSSSRRKRSRSRDSSRRSRSSKRK
ncbi:hypothetical protein DFQ28_009229 [Apophysomyces sp. BC1034]|nr:hypothetical protein DFQ30_003312 [Apophysomyces sp. BC1015]KAG0185493.1 hypothetical protein DFQ28_009229 [Apophysomyces sp. BC1034]